MKLLKHYNEGCPAVVVALEKVKAKIEVPLDESAVVETTDQEYAITSTHPNEGQIIISNAKEDVVIIDVTTGEVQIREGYQPNEAAVLFWDAFKDCLNTEIRKPQQPTLPHTIPLVACPPELQYLAPGHTVGLRIVGRYTLQGVEIEESELV